VYLVFTNNLAANEKKKDNLKGKIESPLNKAKVERFFSVKGTIKGQYRHLWLAVRIGDLYWPKEPKLNPNSNRWTSTVNEGGTPPDGKFDLVLLDVSEETNNYFNEWLTQGHQSRSFPGIPSNQLGSFYILDAKKYSLSSK